jgi:hypothetical protein
LITILIYSIESFKGLRETSHPFNFVAQTGFKDLLETQDADEKAINVLTKLIIPLKNALVILYYS